MTIPNFLLIFKKKKPESCTVFRVFSLLHVVAINTKPSSFLCHLRLVGYFFTFSGFVNYRGTLLAT